MSTSDPSSLSSVNVQFSVMLPGMLMYPAQAAGAVSHCSISDAAKTPMQHCSNHVLYSNF